MSSTNNIDGGGGNSQPQQQQPARRRRGRNDPSDVRGPSSALSSFLRERGIRAPRLNPYQRLPPQNQQPDNGDNSNAAGANPNGGGGGGSQDDAEATAAAADPTAGPSTPAAPSRAGSSSRKRARPADDDDDDDENGDDDNDKVTGPDKTTPSDSEFEAPPPTPAPASGRRTRASVAAGTRFPAGEAAAAAKVAKGTKNHKKAAGKGGGRKKKKKGDHDDDDDSENNNNDDDNDAYVNNELAAKIAPRSGHSKRRRLDPNAGPSSSSSSAAAAAGGGNGPPSLLRFCRRCLRKYVPEAEEDELCVACAGIPTEKGSRGGGGGGGKGGRLGLVKRRKAKLVDDVADGTVPSLRDMCMQVIAENIEQVEAFGDIPDNVKRGIARILSRRRQINKNTMNLFIGPEEHSVELFDCARLDSDALSQIGYMSMNLRILNLSDCGQMTDSALSIFADTCKHLTSLTLKGPFLVTDGAFANLFSRLETRLEEVYLENAAKLADKGLNALVEMCMRGGDGGGDGKGEERVLRRLGLNHCQSVTDGALKHLCRLGGVGCDAPANGEGEPGPEAGDDDEAGVGARLESLELGHLGGTSDAAIVELLAAVGPGLRKLFLIGFPEMTDSVLQTGIAPHCPRLDTLSLAHDESLSDAGLVAFFNAWHDTRRRHPGARLARLDLTRVVNLGDAALTTVAQLHGADLESLSINSLDDLTGDALRSLAAAVGGGGGGGGRLRELDVSFVRACDDDVFAALAAASAMLERVAVYGCNRLTEVALGGVGGVRNAAGRAVRVVGTEFA